jgi:hypothetical protein
LWGSDADPYQLWGSDVRLVHSLIIDYMFWICSSWITLVL